MKSIMEEASTIFKAIEKAWILADKPQSFSVKVLEEAEKNFFGMTTKSAKIALLFDEGTISLHQKPKTAAPAQQIKRAPAAPQAQREQPKRPAPQARTPEQPRAQEPVRERRENREQQRPARVQKPAEQAPRQERQERSEDQNTPGATWSPELNASANKWMQNMVDSLDSGITFVSAIKNNQLVIEFNKPLIDNGRDRLLFSSLAHLMMQSIRHEYKNQTRGLKVVLKLQN